MIKKFPQLLCAGALALSALVGSVRADDTVKVGVLHDLSGTMAISETSLRDILLFTFDEINAKGGVLGKKIEPVIVDPGSIWKSLAMTPIITNFPLYFWYNSSSSLYWYA